MVRIVSNTIIKFNRVQKKKLHSSENRASHVWQPTTDRYRPRDIRKEKAKKQNASLLLTELGDYPSTER
jgi:hypothetical protein